MCIRKTKESDQALRLNVNGGDGSYRMKRSGKNQPSRMNQPLSARQILEQRYARGEINQEQYILMSKDIQ
jgi:hypothetical protein